MHHSLLVVNHDPNQAQLFQDLSVMLKFFKKTLQEVDTIMILLLKQEQCSEKIAKFRNQISDHDSLFDAYNYEIHDNSVHTNTFYRFLCRISEIISSHKNKLISNQYLSVLYTEYIANVEKSMDKDKNYRNIGKKFKKLCFFSQKLCNCLTIYLDNNGNNSAIQNLFKVQKEQKLELTSRVVIEAKKFTQSQSNFNKFINQLDRRFMSFNCLNLDYNAFKRTYFMSQSEKDLLYSESYERNKYILNQINSYSFTFNQYLKKQKNKLFIRRNRVKEDQKRSVIQSPTKSLLKKKDIKDRRESKIIENVTIEKKSILEDRLISLEEKSQTKKEDQNNLQLQIKKIKDKNTQIKNVDGDHRKTSYHMKNIYFALNKLKEDEIKANKISNYQNSKQVFSDVKVSSKNAPKIQYKSLKTNKNIDLATITHQKWMIEQIKKTQFKNKSIPGQNPLVVNNFLQMNLEDKDQIIHKYHFSKLTLNEKRNNIRVTQNSKFLHHSNIARNEGKLKSHQNENSLLQIRVIDPDQNVTIELS